jgi:hypothetical protein
MAAGVVIALDPHKRAHTAFVIDEREKRLGSCGCGHLRGKRHSRRKADLRSGRQCRAEISSG